MSDDKKTNIKDYVENKIGRFTFHAKNFDKDEMDRVDEYCKRYYGNDRKKMILTLITLVENNVLYNILNDKVELLTENFIRELEKVYKLVKPNKEQEETEPSRVSWKGFGDK